MHQNQDTTLIMPLKNPIPTLWRRRCITGCTLLFFALSASAVTLAELQAENELLRIRSRVNFLSLSVIICVIMIFFMWGIKARHRKHLMMVERKNRALQRSNELLEESRAFAERQSQLKTIYTINLSHEIRTPLNQMYGFAEMLADENLDISDEERKEMSKMIYKGCRQLTHIVEDINKVAAKLEKMETLSEVESVLLVQD